MTPDTLRPSHRPPGRILRAVPVAALGAVIVITASSEWALARTVLALPPAVAWAVPVAIDSYVVAALRTGRDVGAALAVMAGALCASTAAHLAAAGQPPGEALPVEVIAPTATVIMAVLVAVAWRVHVLIELLGPTTAVPRQAGHEYTPDPEYTPAVPTPGYTPAGEYTPDPEYTSPAPGYTPPSAGDRALHPNADRSGGSAAALRAAATTTPADGSAEGPSDEEILADLASGSPGIRALRRTYNMGQKRATRLHQQAQEQGQKSQIQDDGERNESTQVASQGQTTRMVIPSESEGTNEKPIKESHPCITDRVGGGAASGGGHQGPEESDSGALSDVLSTVGRR